jgi:hypothetical protein
MHANVRGRVRNTHVPKSQPLLPLFEAIANAIDAIVDRFPDDATDGHIEIRILRDNTLFTGIQGDLSALDPIKGFSITDNGAGFHDANWAAFNEADTQHRAQRGGKGVGRFTWLVVFERAEVESTFVHAGNTTRRSFSFSLANDEGVGEHELAEVPSGEQGTTVRLLGLRGDYAKNVPRASATIAQRIIEHCIEYFLLNRMPRTTLLDGEQESIDLDQIYDRLVASTHRETVDISGIRFDIAHFMLHARSDLGHHISYCADNRVVRTDKIGSRIDNLPSTLGDEGGTSSYIYAGYVSSVYLDKHVNSQRTEFDMLPDDGFDLPGELSWSDVEDGILASVKTRLEPFTEKVRADKARRIREYVETRAPEYRYILKNRPEQLDAIPPDVSDDALDGHLHEIGRRYENDVKATAEEIFAESGLPDEDRLTDERLSKWLEDANEVGKANLAKYIVLRKWVLTCLDKALKAQAPGHYSREEVIHRIIFPLRKTSDDLTYERHNLWILDEKLAYHHYLASDIPLNKVEPLQVESAMRPDLLVFFDQAIAVVDEDTPYNNGIVVFEFKRPMRTDYNGTENPIAQVLGYVEQMRAGKALTKDGRPINIQPSTRFYCYIVADLTPELVRQARFHNLQSTPDGCGYFSYHTGLNAYIEVIAFDKLVSDANKRNRILFDKLHLPSKI